MQEYKSEVLVCSRPVGWGGAVGWADFCRAMMEQGGEWVTECDEDRSISKSKISTAAENNNKKINHQQKTTLNPPENKPPRNNDNKKIIKKEKPPTNEQKILIWGVQAQVSKWFSNPMGICLQNAQRQKMCGMNQHGLCTANINRRNKTFLEERWKKSGSLLVKQCDLNDIRNKRIQG